jgi:protein TonB
MTARLTRPLLSLLLLATTGGALASPAPVSPTEQLPTITRRGPGDPSCARPVYPQSSLRNNEQGRVVLSYLIGLDGSVLDGKIARSSGYPDLDRAAYVALSKCLYRMPDGAQEPRWMSATYVWTLSQ